MAALESAGRKTVCAQALLYSVVLGLDRSLSVSALGPLGKTGEWDARQVGDRQVE